MFKTLVLFTILLLVVCECKKHHKHDKKEEGHHQQHHHRDHVSLSDHKLEKPQKVHWKKHKPVDESKDTPAKKIWEKMSDYHKLDDDACDKLKCRKREVCLVNAETKKAECVLKKSLRLRQRQRKMHRHKEAQKKFHATHDEEFMKKTKLAKEEVRKFEQKHDKSMKHKMQHMKVTFDYVDTDRHKKLHPHHNVPSVPLHKTNKHCSQKDMDVMGRRLLDWFKLLHDMEDKYANHHKEKRNSKKKELKGECICQAPVSWQFQKLDKDVDGHLSVTELRDIEHNGYEHCVAPFIDACDHDKDTLLSEMEWCCCFADVLPPCEAEMRKKDADTGKDGKKTMLLGSFVPQCDEDGFYSKMQCHASVGDCWCVDRNGYEIEDTRGKGDPDCEKVLKQNHNRRNTV